MSDRTTNRFFQPPPPPDNLTTCTITEINYYTQCMMHVFYLEYIAAASSVFMSLDTYYIFSSFNTTFFVESILHGNDVHRAYTFILPIRSCRNQPTNQPNNSNVYYSDWVCDTWTFNDIYRIHFAPIFLPRTQQKCNEMKSETESKAKAREQPTRPTQTDATC